MLISRDLNRSRAARTLSKTASSLNVVGTASYFAAFGAAGAGAAAGFASVPHSALRKSSHSPCVPLSVPALLAALYFSTHSRMVSARAGAVTTNAAKPIPAIGKSSFGFKLILVSLPRHDARWLNP
jgi:hypothetical protein